VLCRLDAEDVVLQFTDGRRHGQSAGELPSLMTFSSVFTDVLMSLWWFELLLSVTLHYIKII